MGALSFSHTHQHPAGTVTSCPSHSSPLINGAETGRPGGAFGSHIRPHRSRVCSTLRPIFYWTPNLISSTASWQNIHLLLHIKPKHMVAEMNGYFEYVKHVFITVTASTVKILSNVIYIFHIFYVNISDSFSDALWVIQSILKTRPSAF